MTDVSSEWQTERLDVSAYLHRVGVTDDVAADASTLFRLHRAHVLTFPFENFDAALGRGVDIDLDAVQAKLVGGRRGGYCYEHNSLFAAVLERLGYGVTRHAGRVMLGIDHPTARTHIGLHVVASDGEYLADVGFGPGGLIEPLPWADGAEATQDGWRYRLQRRESGWWSPLRWDDGGWLPMYRLSPEPQHRIDFEVGNYYVSTHPSSPFTGRLFAGRKTAEGNVALNDGELVHRRPDLPDEVTTIGADELGTFLASTLGIDLPPADVAALGELLATGDQPPAAAHAGS